MTMKLYWSPRTRSSRVIWLLEEAGVDYQLEKVDLSLEPARRGDEFLRVSPMGKVPALVDGEVGVADSAAIALYVTDKHAGRGLAPDIASPLRGTFLYWMFFTPGVLEPALSERMAKIEPNRSRNGWGDFDTMIEVLRAGVTPGPWLLGDAFSAADVLVGSSVAFLRRFGIFLDIPELNAYADRCEARPSYQKAISLDDSEG